MQFLSGIDLPEVAALPAAASNSGSLFSYNGMAWYSNGVIWIAMTDEQIITLTGDVTGSGTGSFAATIAANSVTNTKLADVATSTIKGRVTAATGDPEDLSVAQVRTLLSINNVDNTSDANKPVSTAQATANTADRNRANHTGTQLAATISDFSTAAQTATLATTISNGVTTSAPNQNIVYDTLASLLSRFTTVSLQNSTIAAGAVVGLYSLQPTTVTLTGVGVAAVPTIIDIKAADYPTVMGLTVKLRINAIVSTNDFAPGTTFTFGLYPVTRPAVSGGANVLIYDLGTVVTGSNGAQAVTPAADTSVSYYSSEFSLPSDGLYTIGLLTSVATVATSSRVHFSLELQMRYA